MNQNSINTNNIYNKNEIKNKLQNFQEGKDYFITPTKEGKIKDYTFFNDRLKSLFGGNNWIPVRVWQEKYDDQNVSYRGHFEEGKNYSSSIQSWVYDPIYQGDQGTEDFPFLTGIKWDKHSRYEIHGEEGRVLPNEELQHHWRRGWSWTYTGKGEKHSLSSIERLNTVTTLSLGPTKKIDFAENQEVENHRRNLVKLEEKKIKLKDKIEGLSSHIATEHPIADEKGLAHEKELRGLEKVLIVVNDKIRYHEDWLKNYHYNENTQQKGRIGRETEGKLADCCNCGLKEIKFLDNYCQKCGAELCDKAKSIHSNLEKENFELRQQLAQVQAELAKVLAELKKLTGKNEALDKLDQQQAWNEKAMREGSAAQIREQVNKSQALVQEASMAKTENTTAPQSENKPKNGVPPYAIVGGSLAACLGIIVFCWKKRSRK
ncbi:MAG: hypothetical protein MRERC_5c052 [Mycoplasmataceae bacterium RC_NB112A]|nr:MAG: hypothetical protein MRERC_5c052 [Mycoplasmataceae bacterium RC_NB112A]